MKVTNQQKIEAIQERMEVMYDNKTYYYNDIQYLLQRLEIAQKALEKILNNGRIDWTPLEAENVIIMCGDIAEEALDKLKE